MEDVDKPFNINKACSLGAFDPHHVSCQSILSRAKESQETNCYQLPEWRRGSVNNSFAQGPGLQHWLRVRLSPFLCLCLIGSALTPWKSSSERGNFMFCIMSLCFLWVSFWSDPGCFQISTSLLASVNSIIKLKLKRKSCILVDVCNLGILEIKVEVRGPLNKGSLSYIMNSKITLSQKQKQTEGKKIPTNYLTQPVTWVLNYFKNEMDPHWPFAFFQPWVKT